MSDQVGGLLPRRTWRWQPAVDSAETMRVRLRMGAASARQLKGVLCNRPADTATATTATATLAG